LITIFIFQLQFAETQGFLCFRNSGSRDIELWKIL